MLADRLSLQPPPTPPSDAVRRRHSQECPTAKRHTQETASNRPCSTTLRSLRTRYQSSRSIPRVLSRQRYTKKLQIALHRNFSGITVRGLADALTPPVHSPCMPCLPTPLECSPSNHPRRHHMPPICGIPGG